MYPGTIINWHDQSVPQETVVDNIDNANGIARLINYRYRIVTLDGEIIHVGGSLTGGMQKKSTSIILDKMELDKLVMENNKLKSYLSDIQNDINNNKDVIDRNTIKLDTIKRSIIYNTEILNVKSKELDELNEKLDSVKDNISSISNIIDGSFSSEEESIINKYYASVGKKELVVSEISKLNESIKLLSDEINILEHDYKASNSEYNSKNKVFVGMVKYIHDTMGDTGLTKYSDELTMIHKLLGKETIMDVAKNNKSVKEVLCKYTRNEIYSFFNIFFSNLCFV